MSALVPYRAEAPAAPVAGRSVSAASAVRRLAREPLIHFLILGALLFVVFSWLNRGSGRDPKTNQIELTLDDLSQVQMVFASKWQRNPTPEEIVGLVEDKVREEVLYREALALDLDKDDVIVKRRMAQKMEFLAQDVSAAREPVSAELEAWFEKNASRFTQPGRATFRHLYFSPDLRGTRARDEAAKALQQLSRKPQGWPGAAGLSDPFMFQDYLADRSPEQIAKDFGPGFAKSLFAQETGAWHGPIESGYGWHLVFLVSLTSGRVPGFEEVEPEVKAAWMAQQQDEAWRKAYETMRAKYEVVLPASPADDATTASLPP